MRLVIERSVQRTLQQAAEQGCSKERQWQAHQKRYADTLHQQHRDVAAHHGEGPVREVDEVHQPHGHGQTNGQNKQQHAIGYAVKEDGQHG